MQTEKCSPNSPLQTSNLKVLRLDSYWEYSDFLFPSMPVSLTEKYGIFKFCGCWEILGLKIFVDCREMTKKSGLFSGSFGDGLKEEWKG